MTINILSADTLISHLRFGGTDTIATTFLKDLPQDQSWQEKLESVRNTKNKTLASFSIENDVLKVVTVETLLQPSYSPYLVSENITSARAVLADCFELRRRIESLQLDIFNFEQEDIDFNFSLVMHTDNLKNLESTRLYWLSVKERKERELDVQQKTLEAWISLNESVGNEADGYSATQRSSDKLLRDFSSFAMAPSDRALSFTKITNTDTSSVTSAGLDDPTNATIQLFSGSKRESVRSAEYERVQFDSELRRLRNQSSTFEGAVLEVYAAIERTIFEIALVTNKWQIREKLWERKRRQYIEGSGIGLKRRLLDSLYLYDKLTAQLRSLLHSIEFGQSVIFDMTIPGFDASSLSLFSRYTFSKLNASVDKFKDPFGDGIWISLDELAGFLIDAENRQRIVLQQQYVYQTSYLFKGETDAAGDFTMDINLGSAPIFTFQPKNGRKRLCSLRLINESVPCDVALKLVSSERFAVAGLVENEIDKFLRQYSVQLNVEAMQPADDIYMPEILPNQVEYINRHFDGTLSISVSSNIPNSSIQIRLEVTTART